MIIEGYTDKHEYISPRGVKSTVYLMDCMEGLKQIPKGLHILAVVDPPYNLERFRNGIGKNDRHKIKSSSIFNNNSPNQEYFELLFSLSVNQIVWGANNFIMPPSEYFLIWDKAQTVDNFASAEYAWVSMGLKKPAKVYKYSIHQHNQTDKIHPTQKPIPLYSWIYKNYSKPTDIILDSHLGSQSSRIAADMANLEFIGFELDSDYFRDGCKRFDNYTKQLKLEL